MTAKKYFTVEQQKEARKVWYDKWFAKHRNNPEFRERKHIVSKRYYSSHKEKIKANWKARKYRSLAGGELTPEMIQMVYEDNIKFFGTLTCVYCNNPIPFGEDSIDHRVPLARGGTNIYSNLVISCKTCNKVKGTKTWKEYFYRDSNREAEGEWI